MEIDETISAAFAFVKPIHDDMARTELQRLSWQDGKRHLNNTHRRVKMDELINHLRNPSGTHFTRRVEMNEKAANILERISKLPGEWERKNRVGCEAAYDYQQECADELRATWGSADG